MFEAPIKGKRNKNEMWDRKALFTMRRIEMCAFIGVKAGPGVTQGGGKVTRG